MNAPIETHVRVIIVHWNRPEDCCATITAFLAQDVPVDIRVLDNGSPPSALEAIRSTAGADRVVRLDRNQGFGSAANVGLREWLNEKGEWAVVAAHDAALASDCVRRLLAAVSERPRAGIVCPEYGVGDRPALGAIHGTLPHSAPRGSGWERVRFPHGTLMMLRRQCLQDVGLFDERYFAYGEAEDLGLRATAGSWEVGMVWGALVRNPGTSVPSRAACYLQTRNSLLLVREHLGLGEAIVRTAVALLHTPVLVLARRRRPANFSVSARILGVLDFWRGRLGAPPDHLLGTAHPT